MAYFDELLQRAITVRNNRAPASNTADLVGGVLVGIVTALQMLLDDKQDELTFDNAPTADSQNPVTSDGIYQALQAIDLSACEKIVNKVTSINAQSTNVQYPTAKLLYDSLQALSGIYAAIVHTHAIADIINLQTELNARQLVSNLVTAITAQSTDQQYPSAKLLYDQLQGLAAVYAPKVHTHPFADIERPANVASVNAQGYTITTAYYSHVLTITADATLRLPTMQSGAAIILRLTIIQDATGGRAVTFDGGAALVFNPYQTDLSLGQANYRCWVVLWFDGVNWAWLASPYVLRAESQFAYTIDGTTGGQYVTVTINGTTMQIQATSGVWQYGYNNPINSIAFTGDTGVLNVDFTNSDGLANITTLADAFKNCAALVAVDFTGCDLSNVATAADCFAGCTSLAALTIPTGTWKPDIDLSACAAFTKAAMLAVIDGLYTYASGTHTVTFNSTAWDALSQADQQQVYNAAAAKGWTTNAVAVSYVISGTSSNVNGTETFNIQFIQDNAQTPDPAETITVNVDANGDWSFNYSGKKIYSLAQFAYAKTRITTVDFSGSDGLLHCISTMQAFASCTSLTSLNFGDITFENVLTISQMFNEADKIVDYGISNCTFASARDAYAAFALSSMQQPTVTAINLASATFASLQDASYMFSRNSATTINLASATFASLQNSTYMFQYSKVQNLDLSKPTFASVTSAQNMFLGASIEVLDLSNATFESAQNITHIFYQNYYLQTLKIDNATFNSATNAEQAFGDLPRLISISMPKATFANATNILYLFGSAAAQASIDVTENISMPLATFAAATNITNFVRNKRKLTALYMPSATFASVNTTQTAFQYANLLTDITVPGNATAILPTSTAANAPVNLASSPLTYASMLAVANWLSNLTGYSAHTITFNTTAWNALTAAEQSNIDTILSGKNWTRVLA